ncbi:MAG: prepilin-type N-terminal cleavage/methylation domain-containing protein [Candidatus Omnitrophota bacterium]
MFNKKGFTLVELLMVVIIIGILVTLAVPNYYRSIERAKGGKAKAALDGIRKAELQYRAFNDTYTGTIADLAEYDLPPEIAAGADSDWAYTIPTSTSTALGLTATRSAGPHATEVISMDQDGVLTSTIGDWGVR